MRLLLVEDDLALGSAVHDYLVRESYAVDWAPRLGAARAFLPCEYMAVVLDLGLPDGDGVDFIRDLRGWSGVPIVVLSARSDEQDKIEALDAGADDYLTKPFGVGELLARVRASLRRASRRGEEGDTVIAFSDVSVDLVNRVVKRAGLAVHLTPIEYRLLTFLTAQPGKVLTHRQLLREVWGPSHVDSSHYLRIYMGHLRHKLEVDPTQPRHFITETGVGYRFVQ